MDWLTQPNAEKVIDLWHRFKGRPISRNAGYLILAAVGLESNIVQLLIEGGFSYANVKVDIPDTPHWVTAVFVIAAVVLLIADRLIPITASRPEPNPHDVHLFEQFRGMFDDDVLYFLRTHDFGGGSFHSRYFKVFNNISADWIGGRYNFDDAEMAQIWKKFFAKNRELAELIAVNTTPNSGNMDFCQPWWYAEDFHTENITERVKLMNDTATEMAELIDQLEAEARRKWISSPPLKERHPS
jgi:hypothetical protein